jgi:hypothetical protein
VSRTYNSFWEVDDIKTVAVPASLAEDLLRELNPTSVALYIYLLGKAAQLKKSVMELHTGHVLYGANLSNKTLKTARTDLKKHGLVEFGETTKRGHWEYVLLNPLTSAPLPSRNNVNFAKLPNSVVYEFFKRQIPEHEVSSARWHCPFGDHDKAAFKVKYDRGTETHGTWSCTKCKIYGGLLEFHRRLHQKSAGETSRAVRAMLQTLIQEEQKSTVTTGQATPQNSLVAEL